MGKTAKAKARARAKNQTKRTARKTKADANRRDVVAMNPQPSTHATTATLFHQFSDLNDDLQFLIISFIANAPKEERHYDSEDFEPSALTSIIPTVNKKFHDFAQREELWKAALIRQLRNGSVWKEGLQRVVSGSKNTSASARDASEPPNSNGNSNSSNSANSNSNDNYFQEELRLLQKAHDQHPDGYKSIYKKIYVHHVHLIAPVFIMPCDVHLGEMYGLHLFEPRYRIMVHTLLSECGNPDAARSGCRIEPGWKEGMSRPPMLIHACRGARLGIDDMACLVELKWCHTYEDATADVRLLPVAWVKLDRIWVRQASYGLFYGKAMRV